MFSCFGFRPRHKGLASSGLSDKELRYPLTPKDGVPLNTHNHHHKHALFQHYYSNTPNRNSLNSSRRNSQASNTSAETAKTSRSEERRKSTDLTPDYVSPNGLKITDIDNNTTDIIKCKEQLKTGLKEDQGKTKSSKSKKKRKANTLPRNITPQDVEKYNRVNCEQVNNEKNYIISEIINNNDLNDSRSIVKNERVEAALSIKENKIIKQQNNPVFKVHSKSELSVPKTKVRKEMLNRSLSPTDLDSFMAQNSVYLISGKTDSLNNFDGVSRTDVFSISTTGNQHSCDAILTETPPSVGVTVHDSRLNSYCGNGMNGEFDSKIPVAILAKSESFHDSSFESTANATPTDDISLNNFDLNGISPIPKNVSSKINFKYTSNIASLKTYNTNNTISFIPKATTKNISNVKRNGGIAKIDYIKPAIVNTVTDNTPIMLMENNKTKSKIPSKTLHKSHGKSLSNNHSKQMYPGSYTRLPIALDRKLCSPSQQNIFSTYKTTSTPIPKSAITLNEQSQNAINLQKNNELNVDVLTTRTQTKNSDKSSSLINTNDSSIPLIDVEDTVKETSVSQSQSLLLNDSSINYNNIVYTEDDASSELQMMEAAYGSDCSDSSIPAQLSLLHREAFRRKKRKPSNPERDDYQPIKSSRTTKVSSAADAAELKRLEAALSAKTTEAETAKREAETARTQATEAGKGVEALTVLVHHLTHQYEAFSNPNLKTEIARLQKCLEEAEQALGESRRLLEAAETRLSEEQASAVQQTEHLKGEHSSAVQQLTEEHQQTLQLLQQEHLQRLDALAQQHKGDTLEEQGKHRLEIIRITQEHEKKLSEEQSSHEVREQDLEVRGAQLLKEQEKLRDQSRKLQDSLLSDNDHRLTAVKNYCTSLQQEVDSLKSVVEMRNTELHKLRAQVLGMEKLERDLESARHCAKTLQAKTEDLNAQMDAKAKTERHLLSSNRELAENMNRESNFNKQLRRENEELQWKLRQRELSTSLPLSTLDLMTRVCHLNNTSWEERPSSLHHSQHGHRESQQSQVNKGAPRAESRLVTSTPATYTKDGKSNGSANKQQFTSDDKTKLKPSESDSPPSSPCVKAVIEKSNSVSFILDLNDSLPDDSYLEFPASPRLKHGTPTLTRKAIQKSRSSSLDKKVGGQLGKNITLAKCTSAGNFFCKGVNSELRKPCKDNKIGSKKENGTILGENQLGELSRRLHSTSESSGGADSENLEGSIERVSPSGMSWTVPVNGSSPSSPLSPVHSHSRNTFASMALRHLHQPEEDEYEENMEGSEDGYINGLHPDITPLVNLMNVSSSSPSDSELSRCGSQACLTSESEEESSIADGDRVTDSLSPVVEVPWIPQVGAGEAMVPSELVVHCGSAESSDQSDKATPTKDVKLNGALPQTVATPSISDADDLPQVWSEGEFTSSSETQEN